MVVFIVVQVPIFAGLVALIASENPKIRSRSRTGVGLFFLIHAILHILFKGHPAHGFSAFISNLLIFGSSALGVAFLLPDWNERRGPLNS
jgi:hypothetical protein